MADQCSMVAKAIRAGHMLREMKEQVDAVAPKTWLKWCDDNIRIKRSQIRNYMLAAERESLLPDYQSSGNPGGLAGFLAFTAPPSGEPGQFDPVDLLPEEFWLLNQVFTPCAPHIGDPVFYFDARAGWDDFLLIVGAELNPAAGKASGASGDQRGVWLYTLAGSRRKPIKVLGTSLGEVFLPEGSWGDYHRRGVFTPVSSAADPRAGTKEYDSARVPDADICACMAIACSHAGSLEAAVRAGEQSPQSIAWQETRELIVSMARKAGVAE